MIKSWLEPQQLPIRVQRLECGRFLRSYSRGLPFSFRWPCFRPSCKILSFVHVLAEVSRHDCSYRVRAMRLQQSMRMSEWKRKQLRERAAEIRKEYNLSQDAAARLLGISKNTWVRWETGKFAPDETLLELLPCFVRNKCPSPCSSSRAEGFDEARMAEHIQHCRVCWLAINYLAVVARKAPPPRNPF